MAINMNQNKDGYRIRKLKNSSLGLLVGAFIWFFILILNIVVGSMISSINSPITHAIGYLCYVTVILLFSTCILIGIYFFNRDNLMVKKLLKIDVVWLFVGIFMAIIEVILNQNYHAYNEHLPLLIYMLRLMMIYMFIDKIADDNEKIFEWKFKN